MKKICLILMALVLTAITVKADSLIVDPMSLSFPVPRGGVSSHSIKITNAGETHLSVSTAYDTSWMMVRPEVIEMPKGAEQEVLAVFFFSNELVSLKKGEIIFKADGETATVEVEVAQSGAVNKPISKDMAEVARLKEGLKELRKEIDRLKPYQEIVEDYKQQVQALRSKVHSLQLARGASRKELEALHDVLVNELTADISDDNVQVSWSNGKLLIIVPSVFNSGQVYPNEQDQALLEKIGLILKNHAGDNPVEIRGHSDKLPVSEAMKEKGISSNWELSSMRASTIARIFQYRVGIKGRNLIVSGCSKYRPMYENRTVEGREGNRRVEIFVLVP